MTIRNLLYLVCLLCFVLPPLITGCGEDNEVDDEDDKRQILDDLKKFKIVFVSNRDGNSEIYVMNGDGTNQVNLTNHPADDSAPSWSPDGTRIAFVSYRDGNSEIYVVNADGTNLVNLTNHPGADRYFSWSPDGMKIAFNSDRYDGSHSEIYVMNADGTNPVMLTKYPHTYYDRSYLGSHTWAPDGTKIAFDLARTGPPGTGGDWEIYVMNVNGKNKTNLTDHPDFDKAPYWSPDGTKIAFARRLNPFDNEDKGENEIYVMNEDGTNQVNLTNHPASDSNPTWSPDGMRIAFVSRRDGNSEIYIMNADGTNLVNLTNHPADDYEPTWSPDGTKIAFVSQRDGNSEIYIMSADGISQVNITQNPSGDFGPSWYPVILNANQ